MARLRVPDARPRVRGYHQPASAAACTLSIDDAYAGRAPPRPSIGVLTRFFCGQTAICTAAEPAEAAERDAAYRRAAYNLRHRYAAVAVLGADTMTDTLVAGDSAGMLHLGHEP